MCQFCVGVLGNVEIDGGSMFFAFNSADIDVERTSLLIQTIGIVGGLFAAGIALKNYKASIEQKKFENSYFLIETFHKNLRKTCIGYWEIGEGEAKITMRFSH